MPSDASAGETAPAPPTLYHDMTNPAFWAAFDASRLDASIGAFAGALFDGRSVLFVPWSHASTPSGLALRFGIDGAFEAPASWSTFDTTTIAGGAAGFIGGAFDGAYTYMIAAERSGWIARHAAQSNSTSASAWSAFDETTADPLGGYFFGAVFDGRSIYLAPCLTNMTSRRRVARLDTQSDFTNPQAWSSFDIQALGNASHAGSVGYAGAVFDDRFVYFVPSAYVSGVSPQTWPVTVARYDTSAGFETAASWSSFDVRSIAPSVRTFLGGVFDGRYLYLVPFMDGPGQAIAVRYDTKADFSAAPSWATFDIASVEPNAVGFGGGAFDGRYVYFVPYANPFGGPNAPTPQNVIARYDTLTDFQTPTSWSTFEITSIAADASGFLGAAFDGEYLYLAPTSFEPASPSQGHVVVRFDAKSPASLPATYRGSFL